MRGHVEMISEFYMALGHEKIRSCGLLGSESLLSRLRAGRLGAEKFLTRHFRSILDALESGDLGNVAWIPGTENPADGLTKEKSEIGPLLNLLETGTYRPGRSEQLRGVFYWETVVILFPSRSLHFLPRVRFSISFLLLAAKEKAKMSDRATLMQDLETVLRAHGAAPRDLNNVFQEAHTPYRQFSLQLDESTSDEFSASFKKVVYFAIFAHAPQVSTQVSSKYDRMYNVLGCIWRRPLGLPLAAAA